MTDLNPMRSGNQHTAASAASTTSKAPAASEPPEWVQDLDEEISQWPADIGDGGTED